MTIWRSDKLIKQVNRQHGRELTGWRIDEMAS